MSVMPQKTVQNYIGEISISKIKFPLWKIDFRGRVYVGLVTTSKMSQLAISGTRSENLIAAYGMIESTTGILVLSVQKHILFRQGSAVITRPTVKTLPTLGFQESFIFRQKYFVNQLRGLSIFKQTRQFVCMGHCAAPDIFCVFFVCLFVVFKRLPTSL